MADDEQTRARRRALLWRRASSFVGGLTLMAAGALFLVVSFGDLGEALRLAPVSDTCEHWLADPHAARWVSLTGCRLDLATASSRTWKGWRWLPDAGVDHHSLELFLPVSASDEREAPLRAVVATTDAELIHLMDELAGLPPEKVDPFIDAHRAQLEGRLKPAPLVGYVEPLPSIAATSALKTMDAEGAVVLEQNREPRRANAIFGGVMGVVLALMGLGRVLVRLRADRLGLDLD